MPKLVAFYLREFSYRSDGSPSLLYKFIFCLCLPFISTTFRRARLIALAIAECTNSKDQILRLLHKLTGATFTLANYDEDFFVVYDNSDDAPPKFAYDGSEDGPLIPYTTTINEGTIYVILNGASKEEVEAYYRLLVPFYINYKIQYV